VLWPDAGEPEAVIGGSMTKPELTPYDEIAYPTFPISYTHPDRLATVATHFGMRPAPVERCRVLELGCSAGANLLSMAVMLPESEFVGVDLAGRPIAQGKARVEALGLKNLAFRQIDLLDMAPDYGKFDYIIVHGLYAWVPPGVRDQILAICKGSLQPQGIAYVSYNTFPGCYSRVMIREMMLFHNRDFHDPQQQMQQAITLLKLLANSRVGPDNYTKLLQEEFERTSKRSREGLYHDELAEVFRPVYFYQFMEHAQRHELQFLGEADFFEMHTGGLTPQAKEVLDKISDDIILREQYLDFMRGRAFRKTLLCHKDVRLDRSGKSVSVRSYYVSSQARPNSPAPDFSPGAEETFRSGSGVELITANPLARALLWYLIESQPQRIACEKLLTEVESRARQRLGFVPKPDQDFASDLLDFVWQTYSAGLLDLHVYVPPFATKVSERPVASPLARLEARDSDVITTLHHRSLRLGDALQRGLVMLMDGTRDHDALRKDLLQLFESGALTLLDGDKPVSDMQTVEKRIAAETEDVLGSLARLAVLME
jgi:methyltransferase-like protein/2-polyprenyl-3-methyl-5-hydroxy-6-metoxy-1,4-benzoquinol methylase